MLVMIPLTLDDVVAMCQFLVQARRDGQPFWHTFWLGGTLRDLPVTGPVRPDVVSAKAMVWGVAMPWNLLLSVGLGIWLKLAPSVLGSDTGGPAISVGTWEPPHIGHSKQGHQRYGSQAGDDIVKSGRTENRADVFHATSSFDKPASPGRGAA